MKEKKMTPKKASNLVNGIVIVGILVGLFSSGHQALLILGLLIIFSAVPIHYKFCRCPHCGARFLPWLIDRYCAHCGKPLNEP